LLLTNNSVFKQNIAPHQILVGQATEEPPEDDLSAEQLPDKKIRELAILQKDGQSLLLQPEFLRNSRDSQVVLLRQVIRELLGFDHYQGVITLAQTMSLEERLVAEVQFSHALSLSRLGLTSRSIAAYWDLLYFDTDHKSAGINLGLLLNREGLYDDAQRVLSHVVDLCQGVRKAKALSALASAVSQQGDLARAERMYVESVNHRAGHAATWAKLAEIKRRLKRSFKETSNAYKKAIKLSEKQYRYEKRYGRYLLENLEFEEASDTLKRALSESSKDDQIRRFLAWSLFESDQRFHARVHWLWLSTNASSKDHRLLASHMIALLDQEIKPLQSLENTSDEFLYARGVLSLRKGSVQQAKAYMAAILPSSEWFLRAHRRSVQIES
jgi:Tfp pilus assembly protein PilF